MTPISYPDSHPTGLVDLLHGLPVPDPYRWLEDIDAPETRAWIEAQNQLTESYLNQTRGREAFRKRITELWNYDKYSTPFRSGGRIFFTHNNGLQNQGVLYWMEDLQAEPVALLDPNSLSEDGTVALTGFAASQDGRLLAYGLSAAGSDWQEWRFREVDSGKDLPDRLEWVKFSAAAFSPQAEGFFYSRYDAPEEGQAYKEANYYHKLYFHRLGCEQAEDELVYQRPDQKEWGFTGQVSEDDRYLVISIWKGTQRENGIAVKDLHSGELVELRTDFEAAYEFSGNDGPLLYFKTDLDAPQGRLIAIDLNQPDQEHWREIIPESLDTLQSVLRVSDHFAGVYLHHAHSQLRVFDLDGRPLHDADLPGMGSIVGMSGKPGDRIMFYSFSSFTNPGAVYTYAVEENHSRVFRQPALLFDPEEYISEQVFYSSKDGTRVPMFLTRRKDLQPGQPAPTHLYGYGGFDIPLTPAFSVWNLAWMELGGIFAVANLRGGGEYGKPWHQAGTKQQKQNVFDDFIAAGEWLIANRYTAPGKLGISGRSNGGLLTGACVTQRPDLYGAVLVTVGVLDMLRFHKFTIGWAWVSDYGSPDDPEDFKALLAYSPYHNTRPGELYPPVLISTGDHDDRVFPAHSFKFAAALQAAQGGEAPVLLRVETRAGHGVGKPTSLLIQEAADMAAFLAENLGLPVH
jgi:prolyl oligopeptidase